MVGWHRQLGHEFKQSPGVGVGTPREAWHAAVCGVTKSWTWLSHWTKLNDKTWGLSGGLVVRNLPANAGDLRDAGSIPGKGRSPERGNGTPLQYCHLDNPMKEELGWLQAIALQESDMTVWAVKQGVPIPDECLINHTSCRGVCVCRCKCVWSQVHTGHLFQNVTLHYS